MNRRNALFALSSAAALPLVASKAQAQSVPETAYYVQQTLQNGGFALFISQLALTKSTNRDVRGFATFEVVEQTAVGLALANSNTLPPFTPTADQANTIAKLNASVGTTFDYNYLSAQYTGHYTLLFLQNDLLSYVADPSNELRHIALLAQSNIEQHIALLGDLFTLNRL